MEHYLGLPPDGSAHGPAIDHLIGMLHWFMLALFIGWGTFYVYTLIRFRKSRQPKADYHGVKSHLSSYLEVGIIVIEVILLVGFSIPLWSNRVDDFPAQKDATVVRIVAEQFAWNIHYPGPDGKFGKTAITMISSDNPLGLDRSDPDAKDDITTINQFNLPVDKPVIINLTTKDVIHSLSFPPYRVKQDAIPGEMIPVWFTPTKTTDQIREELRQSFSINDVVKKAVRKTLPGMSNVSIKQGMDMADHVLMQDVHDNTGTAVLTKGENLDAENIERITATGMSEVASRLMAKLDNFISTEEVKDAAGEILVAKDEVLYEEAVSKLIAAGIKEMMVRPVTYIDPWVVMEPCADKAGAVIAAKGDALTEEIISACATAGINEIIVAPATPTEIACAQLCGLGHYRMRGYMSVQTPDDFKKWFDEQQAIVNPPPALDESAAAPLDAATTSTQQESHH